MKILGLDIETAPNTAHVWSLWKQNIAINQIVNTGRVGQQEVYHLHVHVVGGPDRLGPMLTRK